MATRARKQAGTPSEEMPSETEIKHTAGGEMPDTSIAAELEHKAQDYAIAAASSARARKRLVFGTLGGAAGLLVVGGGVLFVRARRAKRA